MKLGERCGYAGPLALAAALLIACGKGASKAQPVGSARLRAPAASGKATASSEPSSTSPPSSALTPSSTPLCRALRVTGEATVGQASLASGDLVDGSEWVSLARGAALTLKHTASGRELSIAGPARFRACRRGREQLLLAQGSVKVAMGMGARPGAEVLIATPIAGVRYADAELSLTLDDKKLSLAVRAGQVDVDAASSSKPVKSPLLAKERLVLALGKPDVTALMARCKEAAEGAEASARRVADPKAPEPLGERAQTHVRARKLARTACTIAASATGLLADPSASAGLWAEAARWEGLWETIPRRGRAHAAEK